jgi:prepilin-type N-terminal cleavage/methylation domain-containing protein
MKKGMTLVEVLLAVAILGVGLVALLTAATRCLAILKAARGYQDAQWALGVGEVKHPFIPPTNDVKEIEVDEEELPGGLRFSRQVEDDEDEDGLYVVRTKVQWGADAYLATEEVVSYIFFPSDEMKSEAEAGTATPPAPPAPPGADGAGGGGTVPKAPGGGG